MQYKLKLFPLLLAVIAVNAVGILLRYFKLDTYVVLIGFRFHISFILPLLIVFREDQLAFIKQIFVDPYHKRTVLPIMWILFPLIIVAGILYYLHKVEVGDPEYFYEFGLSSVVDYPVYLLWNFPQLFCFFIFLALAATVSEKKFLLISFISFLTFCFELVPFSTRNINYFNIISLLFFSLSLGLLIKYFQNIYWFAIVVFSILWLHFLVFGSGSEEIIHLLFASQYSSWGGFLETQKFFVPYLLPAQSALTFILILISSFFRRKRV